MIPVTKPYLPDQNKINKYMTGIYSNGILTNRGPLVRQLETRLEEYLGVKNVILVANGTLALQIAYRALGISKHVITTPFSFVATASSLEWEGIDFDFADICGKSFNLDPLRVLEHLKPETEAIVPTHVYGNPCATGLFNDIAKEKGLKVIYDAAHAFGTKTDGESILNQGDISTLSFHATKLFHTVEGGAIVTNDNDVADKVRLLINFGISGPDKTNGVGINAKVSEVHAAFGLALLDDIDKIIANRKDSIEEYKECLRDLVQFQELAHNTDVAPSYMPVVLDSSCRTSNVVEKLSSQEILTRRYFRPSLCSVYGKQEKSISKSISERVICLPLYYDVPVEKVCKKFIKALR
ncbi:DegT/DnrJ/EryC1/StrS family aminotransferase [Vibrio sp. TBV020]|uniref:DegT/DnrJ/EryC1/StrS family aminotransferase n=1 Tax=Vibrio sp. TBV020 TaxID=3137398 RepID=UPI0038CD3D1E